jgi:DNA sulfur modification protein DndD
MKIRNARIINFRLLKDLTLNFSTSPSKPLTVIRAANESGKTTAQTALVWALYGSRALKGQGKTFPLHPSDALQYGQSRVEISVEIEFELDSISRGRGTGDLPVTKIYRLKRLCVEKPTRGGGFTREGERLYLYEVRASGTTPVDDAEIGGVIESAIPEALKDVYFTDGDSAMSFIEAAATQGVKRQRVRDAIEALLGLRHIESGIRRLSTIAKKFGDEIDSTDYRHELERVNDNIISYEEEISDYKQEAASKHEEVEGLKKIEQRNREKLDEALQLGNKDELVQRRAALQKTVRVAEESLDAAMKRLASLTRDRNVAFSIAGDVANAGAALLQDMSAKKLLPKVSIPLLEELLDRSFCHCGESLGISDASGAKRREHIARVIKESVDSDRRSQAATDLFYSIRSEVFGADARVHWIKEYQSDSKDAIKWDSQLRNLEKELEKLAVQIDEIDDSNVKELREFERITRAKIDAHAARINELAGLTKEYEERRRDALIERDKITTKLQRSGISTAKLDAAQLCQKVFHGVLETLRSEELKKVSSEMNRIFLEMIGSDPVQNDLSTIRRAILTDEFDIKVFGAGDHPLDPDTDLNGASRRAITLAFILALTKNSKVEAPNVIDTPLGMTSGYVKQSIVKSLIAEGSQIILFLTPDEINNIEPIIDQKAGVVFTVTNPAHYPRMLVHAPEVSDSRVVRCECNHRNSCVVCERKSATMEYTA